MNSSENLRRRCRPQAVRCEAHVARPRLFRLVAIVVLVVCLRLCNAKRRRGRVTGCGDDKHAEAAAHDAAEDGDFLRFRFVAQA